jgi:hypothetical protein
MECRVVEHLGEKIKMVNKCWKKSQSSSGYYKKDKSGGTTKINSLRFNRLEDGKYEVDLRRSFDGSFQTISTKNSKPKALKFAKSYMAKHDKC